MRLLLGTLRDYHRDPFPHSLLRTSHSHPRPQHVERGGVSGSEAPGGVEDDRDRFLPAPSP